ncbi:TonB-dependent receptor [Treponema sp.]|uniref:TonB-dependent receptor plug domain-containing protein n=1 Tax=Treponema sp. TaxID=166 RepID=UPI00298DE237|nr:TonB-dependent receptor [Treponema sp.]MCR5613540.1 TonB-dependent receptor [Treponema sp.]
MKLKSIVQKNIFLFFSLYFIFSSTVSAEENDEDVIEVNASKIEQTIDTSVERKTVVTEEDIKKSGAKNAGDALRSLPEINVSTASAGNATESITMQGLGNGYVKIMIDGVAVSSDLSGNTPIFNIPIENIERIEITKGADSVLYGSQSMGGTINIITKKASSEQAGQKKVIFSGGLTEEAGFSPSLLSWKNYTAGSFFINSKHLSNALIGSFDFVPGKEKTTFDALAGNITYFENTKKLLGFVRDTFSYHDYWGNVSLYGLYTDSDQKSNFTKTGYDKGAQMEYRSLRAEGGASFKCECSDNLYLDGFATGKFYYMNTTYTVKAGAYSSLTSVESNSCCCETDVRAHWKAWDINDFIFGINANLESIDGSSFAERKYAVETAVFAQDTVSLFDEKFLIIPGCRIDFAPSIQNSAVNFMATPKLALKYNPTEFTALRLSYGMGYKIPTLKEKYWIFKHSYAPGSANFILYGNPNLIPEKSHSINFGIEQNVNNLFKINAGAYFNYIIDLIDSVVTDASSSPQIREYQNVDKAMTYGAEINLSTELERFKGKIGYAYTEAKFYNKPSDDWQDLALRVRHRVTLSVEYLIPVIETSVSLNAQWNSRQLLSMGTDYYTPDYLMVGASISKKFWDDRIEIYFGADNVLNNIHFIKGTNGETQKTYYGLEEGTMLRLGARLKL